LALIVAQFQALCVVFALSNTPSMPHLPVKARLTALPVIVGFAAVQVFPHRQVIQR
jgi:hypothetical protein